MNNLVSGMILIEKRYGDLHYYISTPYGPRVIDVDGFCTEFDSTRYEKAYIPKSYDDPWVANKETIITF